ncbi:MAG: glycosyltransferase [Candidatus Woesearchaeota archaeon]
MKILLVNKYHYLRGGDCRYVFNLAELLEKNGHEIRHFSMQHPKNVPYAYEADFVSYIDFPEQLKSSGIKSKLKVLFRMLYSKEAREKFGQVLQEFKPDVIHLNNIHKHLTTSIILEANKRHIPVVWTLHDYNLICPNISFVSKDKICERCKKQRYLAPILEKCSNNSRIASSIIAVESLLHSIQSIKSRVNYFISPSQFLKEKFIEYGYKDDQIMVLPNFYDVPKANSDKKTFKHKYFLYLGRISKEKGIETLCKAAKAVNVDLLIAGDGPARPQLEKKYGSKKIRFLGFKSGKELESLRSQAYFVVLPSEWYENNPYSIIESLSDMVPIIGANIGGIPELVKEGKTGFLFESGNLNDLKEKLLKANTLSIRQRNKLGEEGRKYITLISNSKSYYSNLVKIYKKAISEEKWKRQ